MSESIVEWGDARRFGRYDANKIERTNACVRSVSVGAKFGQRKEIKRGSIPSMTDNRSVIPIPQTTADRFIVVWVIYFINEAERSKN